VRYKPSQLSLAIAASLFAAPAGWANPTGPRVVHGQAAFQNQGATLNVTNSNGAIINWQRFSIGRGETTRFNQPSASSSVLNRVQGSDPSQLLGTLSSNGKVFLINPSGILVGQGAKIDVAGFVASTLNLSDANFRAGKMEFEATPGAGKVENRGDIVTPTGGRVYLVGAEVGNKGLIQAPQGQVVLAAGDKVRLEDSSTPGVTVEITGARNRATNLGRIVAESGEVGVVGAMVRNAGVINASQVVKDRSGRIFLKAAQDLKVEEGSRISADADPSLKEGGKAGGISLESARGGVAVERGATLTANGPAGGAIRMDSRKGATLVAGTVEARGVSKEEGSGEKGGTIHILGERVSLLHGARMDASGGKGGGTVLAGGDYQGKNPGIHNAKTTYVDADASIKTDAEKQGDGGKVIVWSDDHTAVHGTLSARGGANGGNGGLIETSGHSLNAHGIRVNTSAPKGHAGNWLIDPMDFTIAASGGDIDGATLSGNLASSNITILSNSGGTSGSGDINVNDNVSWSANTLTLTAVRNVNINAVMTAAGASALVMNPSTANGGLSAVPGGTINIAGGAKLDLSGGSAQLNGNLSGAGTVSVGSGSSLTYNGGNSGFDGAFNNDGTVNLNTGRLSLSRGGTGSGTFDVASGAGLAFTGVSPVFNAGSKIIGSGDIDFNVAGNLFLPAITAHTLRAASTGNLSLGGPLNAAGSGDAIVLVADGSFQNLAGASVLDASNGRWLVWSNDPGSDNRGGLPYSFKQYNASYGASPVLGTGNGFLYTLAPTFTPVLTGTVGKTYDGTIAATLTAANYNLAGVDGDTITLGNINNGTYDTKNAGSGKTVTVSGITLTGAGNGGAAVYGYTLGATTASGAVGSITPAVLNVGLDGSVTKVYDGTTEVNGSVTITLDSVLIGDTVGLGNLTTASYDTRNVGSGKTVTVSGLSLSGADAGNYLLATTAVSAAIGAITPATLTPGLIGKVVKIYDGTTVAPLGPANILLSGLIAGDSVAVTAAGGSYDTRNVGSGKTVTASGLSLSGADAGNYLLADTTALAAIGTINPVAEVVEPPPRDNSLASLIQFDLQALITALNVSTSLNNSGGTRSSSNGGAGYLVAGNPWTGDAYLAGGSDDRLGPTLTEPFGVIGGGEGEFGGPAEAGEGGPATGLYQSRRPGFSSKLQDCR
jgi:filamentous hemagglutinin family protein